MINACPRCRTRAVIIAEGHLQAGHCLACGWDAQEIRGRTVRKVADSRLELSHAELADGCDASPSCLTCPLSKCKYDEEKAYWERAAERRNALIAELSAQRLTRGQIRRELIERESISNRQAHRLVTAYERSGATAPPPP